MKPLFPTYILVLLFVTFHLTGLLADHMATCIQVRIKASLGGITVHAISMSARDTKATYVKQLSCQRERKGITRIKLPSISTPLLRLLKCSCVQSMSYPVSEREVCIILSKKMPRRH